MERDRERRGLAVREGWIGTFKEVGGEAERWGEIAKSRAVRQRAHRRVVLWSELRVCIVSHTGGLALVAEGARRGLEMRRFRRRVGPTGNM